MTLVINCIHKIQWFPLSIAIFSQKSCSLEPTIFEIPQPKCHLSTHTQNFCRHICEFQEMNIFQLILESISIPCLIKNSGVYNDWRLKTPKSRLGIILFFSQTATIFELQSLSCSFPVCPVICTATQNSILETGPPMGPSGWPEI